MALPAKAFPKLFNYYPTFITADFQVPVDIYNLYYVNISVAIFIYLPDSDKFPSGTNQVFKNSGSANATILNPNLSTLAVLTPGQELEIVADNVNYIWQVLTSASGGGGGDESGPGSSTDSAIALWNGTTGSTLKNSSVIISGSTIDATAGNLGLDSVTATIDCNNCTLINVGGISQGPFQNIVGPRTIISGASTATILSLNTATSTVYNMYIQVAVTNSSDMSDSGAYTTSIRIKNVSGIVSSVLFDSMYSLDATLTGITFSTSMSGSIIDIQATGTVGITTTYQANAFIVSNPF